MTAPPDPVTAVNALIAEVAGAAQQVGQPRLAEVLRPVSEAALSGPLRVVVAGERQRGKSRLINVLLGREGLSPVGSGVSTGCYVEFRHAEPESAAVTLASLGGDGQVRLDRRAVELDQVDRYVRVGGEPGVAAVEIGLPAPLLRAFRLVDTPGLGGLDSGLGRITLAALDRADALLFVCDCSQPLLAPEVRFLQLAAERVTSIVVAATGSDAHPAFEQVVDEDRRRLAAHPALRDVPVVAVSSSTAERARALAATQPALVAVLQRHSGVDQLVEQLRQRTAGRGRQLALRNAVRQARTVLTRLGDVRVATQPATDAGPARLAELARRREELRGRLGDEHAVRVEAAHFVQRMRVRPRHVFDTAISALRRSYRELVESAPPAELDGLPFRFEADLADAAREALAELVAASGELNAHLADRLGYTELDAGVHPLDDAVGFEAPLSGEMHRSGHRTFLAMLPGLRVGAIVGGSSGLVGAVGLGAIGALPVVAVGLAAAVAAGWWSTRFSRTSDQRAHLRGWIETAVADARSVFARTLEDRVLQVQQHLDLTLPTVLRERLAEISALQAEANALTAADREQQARVRAWHEQLAAALAALAARADAVDRLVAVPAGTTHTRQAGTAVGGTDG